MCTRMIPLTYDKAAAALDAREHTGAPAFSRRDEFDPVHDAYPGSEVPTYILDSHGPLATVKLTWGFTLEGRPGAVFNTRIETALDQLRRDRFGMWASAIALGRCLVPVRAFYEWHGTETAPSEKTGKPVRRQYRIRMPHTGAFLLAGVQREGPALHRHNRPQCVGRPRARPHVADPRPRGVRRLARPRLRPPRGPQRHSVGD